jgi:hypothetical protein
MKRPMLIAMQLAVYRVDFLAAGAVIFTYDVKAMDAREALVMARIDFRRVRASHQATDYRVFDPVSLTYLTERGSYSASMT